MKVYKLISPEQNGRHLAADMFMCIYVNENFVFWLNFHRIVLLRVHFTKKNRTGLDNGLAPNGRQAIIWTNADLTYWHIYVV